MLLVFSMFNAGLLNSSVEPVVLGLALAYGGLAQLLAGMWEFRRGNTFGAVTFASYGSFWLSFWLLEQFFAGGIAGAERNSATALFYISCAILTALLWVAFTRTTAVVSLMLFLLTVTYLLLGIGDAGSHSEIVKIGGWFGIATAAAGPYAAFASVINSTLERTSAAAHPPAPSAFLTYPGRCPAPGTRVRGTPIGSARRHRMTMPAHTARLSRGRGRGDRPARCDRSSLPADGRTRCCGWRARRRSRARRVPRRPSTGGQSGRPTRPCSP